MAQFIGGITTRGVGNGQTGGSNPGDTGGSNPGDTGGSNPGDTGGSDPRDTGGSTPGDPGGGYARAAMIAPRSTPVVAKGPSVTAQRRINFSIQQQQQSEWCWAAVAVSVERFFNPASKLTQCEVANKVLPIEYPANHLPKSDCGCCCQCCCDPGSCDEPAELELALQLIHKWRTTLDQSVMSPGTLTFEEVCREIDQRRPICVGITWDSGGGHFVVVRGYRLLSSGARQVYVADPLNPSSLLDFDEFTSAYMGDGEWTETDLVWNDWD
jgi:hypothetical protein